MGKKSKKAKYRDKVIEFLIANTPQKKDKKAKSKKQKDIEALISKFGCHASRVAALCSILTGLPIECVKSNELELKKYQVVVPTGNDNYHNYTIGEPVIYIGKNPEEGDDYVAIRADGTLGNNLDRDCVFTRYATAAEIKNITGAQIAALRNRIIVL